MKLAVVGTGYVGLVTGVTLSEMGHHVTCVDIDEAKVQKMSNGISLIYEPDLSNLMKKNIEAGRLQFTTSYEEGFNDAWVIYIAVGTAENDDGSANLSYVEQVATTIALTAKQDTIVVTKSTVPVGTNDRLQRIIDHTKLYHISIEMASNPEFLKEGSAIFDSFHEDRIVIGANSEKASAVLILIEWDEIVNVDLLIYNCLKHPLIMDGKNCFTIKQMESLHFEYHYIVRTTLKPTLQPLLESW